MKSFRIFEGTGTFCIWRPLLKVNFLIKCLTLLIFYYITRHVKKIKDSEIVPMNNQHLAGHEDTLFAVPEKCHILREGEGSELPLKEIIRKVANEFSY